MFLNETSFKIFNNSFLSIYLTFKFYMILHIFIYIHINMSHDINDENFF